MVMQALTAPLILRSGSTGERLPGAFGLLGLVAALAFGAPAQAHAPAAAPYPAMAPLAAYRTASREAEIAMARSAAPASISDKAEVLVLGERGYETAVQGSNGFACIVQRAWANDFSSAEFWNPKARAPICFNAASARTVLPAYLARTAWVLSGKSIAELEAMTRDAVASGQIKQPEAGAMCYMMSRQGYLNDEAAGPWHPHLMFYTPPAEPESWGGNLPGAPVLGAVGAIEPLSIFMVRVAHWSDGVPDAPTS